MKRSLLLAIFILNTFSYAQYDKGNSVIIWSSGKWVESTEGVEGASTKDWRESVENYFNARNKKDRLLKSSMLLTHYWTGASYDFHNIVEFNNMADATKWAVNAGDLNKRAWPNEEEREAALKAYNKYVQSSYHKDIHVWENHVPLMKKNNLKKSPDRTVVSVITNYWRPLSKVENGSSEERKKLIEKYFKEVTMKNAKVLSQRVVTHYWSGYISNGEWPVTTIREYASIADADDTETENELFNKAFSEDEQKIYSKYWLGKHKDIGLFHNEAFTNK